MRLFLALGPTAVLLLLASRSGAQFRVFGGPQLSSARYTVQNVTQPTSHKQGFMAGIGLTTAVEGTVYFAPSLYVSQKGYEVRFNRPSVPPDADARNNNTTLQTVALAPLLQVNLAKGKSHVFIRVGPAFEMAFSGRERFDSAGIKTVDRSLRFSPTGYSAATVFANAHLGYQHKSGFHLFVHYEHGLSSLNNADGGPMILQRVAGVAVGWKF